MYSQCGLFSMWIGHLKDGIRGNPITGDTRLNHFLG